MAAHIHSAYLSTHHDSVGVHHKRESSLLSSACYLRQARIELTSFLSLSYLVNQPRPHLQSCLHSTQNVGRRRYPTYWISGTKVLVRTPRGQVEEETSDQAEMALEEGRSPWLRNVSDEDIRQFNPDNPDSPTPVAVQGKQNGRSGNNAQSSTEKPAR